MVDIRELEQYLNDKSAKKGDVVLIEGEGEISELEDRKVLNLPVSIEGRKLTWTPGKNARRPLEQAFGFDTKEWVGKTFAVDFYKQQTPNGLIDVLIPVVVYRDQ